MVTGNSEGCGEIRISKEDDGGSSRVLSRELAALRFMASAGLMMAIL